MKRLASRKSHSWWWDSHISPKNSKWLSENLEQMDRLVKEMLKLIEEEGDSFAKKAEMYYRRRPELISHVEDFYRMYRALAERYDFVTGELRKNMPSDFQSQGSGNYSDFATEPASPSSFSPDRTPERKQNPPKPLRRAAGFDVFLGSTTSSDFSRKGSDDSSSSSSSESGSDSEDGKVVDAYDNSSGLNAHIIQLENELREAREKIKEYEKGSNGQCVHLVSIDEHPEPKEKIAAEDEDVEAESDNKTVVLETEACNHKDEINSLKEAMEAAAKHFEAEISCKDHTIEEYKTQLDAVMNRLTQEKCTLEAELRNSIADLTLEAEQLSEKKSSLEIRILELEQMIKELKMKLAESSERFFHEKSLLESKVCSLMNSENILSSKLQALGVVEVEGELHSEAEDIKEVLEAEISNHKTEIKSLKEAMKAAATQSEAEILLKDRTFEEYKTQFDAEMSKLKQEKSTVEAELRSSIADLKLEAEKLSEKKCCLEIRILVQEQTIKELKVKLAESSKRFFHEKSSLESKVCSLMNSENILSSKLQALGVVEVEGELHSEPEDIKAVLEAEISNHKTEIKSLKEAMQAAAKQFEAEISLKDRTFEEYKTQLEAEMSKLKQEKSTIEAELRSSIADLKLEAEKLSEKKCSLEIRILVLEQKIEDLKVMSAEAFERLLHEKSILESKVCGLVDSLNSHSSKLQALEVEAELHHESEDRRVVLEAEISNYKIEMKCLKETMEATAKQFETEISLKDHTIEEYKTQLDEAKNKFMQEKSTVEAELKSSIADLKLEAEQLSEKKSNLEIIISKQEKMIKELKVISNESSERLLHEKSMLESTVSSLMDSENIHESKLQALEDRIRELEAEKTETCNMSTKRIDELNKNLDTSKVKIDKLTSEKDELNARVRKLIDDAKCRDDNCHSMADHLHQLHIEHVNLIKEIEDARKNSMELMNRVRELEEDVERQRVLILDSAEGKREAIRQLCFSLEHYRDGYQKLRQMLQGHTKRFVVMAT